MMVTDVSGREVELEEDWGLQAHRAAVEHLARCWDWYDQTAEDSDAADGAEDPSVDGFCGGENCLYTCQVREVIHAVLPYIEAGLARDGA